MPPVPFLAGLPGLFFAGAIAICAMILPGVSGSFMLVLMGMYEPVLSAIKTVQVTELLTLAAGCVTGLGLFARLLDRVLKSYRARAMAFLSGVLMGSLVAVWPWRAKILIESGADAVTVMRPVLPGAVSEPQLGVCVAVFSRACFWFGACNGSPQRGTLSVIRHSALIVATMGLLLLTSCADHPPAVIENKSTLAVEEVPEVREATPRSPDYGPELPRGPHYVVEPGDTLYSVAFRLGMDHRTLARVQWH